MRKRQRGLRIPRSPVLKNPIDEFLGMVAVQPYQERTIDE